jgi:hypothetical protein
VSQGQRGEPRAGAKARAAACVPPRAVRPEYVLSASVSRASLERLAASLCPFVPFLSRTEEKKCLIGPRRARRAYAPPALRDVLLTQRRVVFTHAPCVVCACVK